MLKLLSLFKPKARPRPRPRPLRHAPTTTRPRSEADWARLRSPPQWRDAMLTELTLQWLERLPRHERPMQLCARFPRVANRIALCWNDRNLTSRIFMSLLLDRRGKRKGFPAPVAYELMRLRALFAARHHIDLNLWESQDLATVDR